jgi:uncharacterized protein
VGNYSVNIIGLSNKLHHFEYEIGEQFFSQYGTDLVSQGHFQVNVALDKHETFIEAEFVIKGIASLVCDRTLEPFDQPIEKKEKLLFKYGERDEEISDEIVMINRETTSLELGQYIYEFIALAVPMKKIHPRFNDEEYDSEEGKIVYSSGKGIIDGGDDDETIDPRWNILKKLK